MTQKKSSTKTKEATAISAEKRNVTGMCIYSPIGVEIGHISYKPGREIDHDLEPDGCDNYDSEGISVPIDAKLVVSYDEGEDDVFALDGNEVERTSEGLWFDASTQEGPFLFVRVDWEEQTWSLSPELEDSFAETKLQAFSASDIQLTTEDLPNVDGNGIVTIVKSVSIKGEDGDLFLDIGSPNGYGVGNRSFAIAYKGKWFDVSDDYSWKPDVEDTKGNSDRKEDDGTANVKAGNKEKKGKIAKSAKKSARTTQKPKKTTQTKNKMAKKVAQGRDLPQNLRA